MTERAKVTVIITLIGLIVYANALFNNFVFDDLGLIVNNPSVHSLTHLPALFLNQNASQLVSHYYRPLSQILYTLIYAIFNTTSFWYHLVQLIFHLANSSLVYLLFKKHFKPNISLVASLIFLVHPINQFTVAYISSLHDVLYMFFGLLSLFFLQNPVLTGLFLFFSLLSKESGIQFIVISSLYLYLFNPKRFPKHLAVSLVVCLIYGFFRFVSATPVIKDPLVPIMTLSLSQRLIHIPAIIFYYFKTYFFPKDILAFHSWIITKIDLRNFFLPLVFDLVAVAVTILGVFSGRKSEKNLAYLFLGWLLIGLGLHSQIIPIDMTVSDHFFYFAQIGLLGLLALLINRVKFSITIPSIILIGILSLITINRNFDWRNQSRLLSHDQAVSPPDYLLELLVASDLLTNKLYSDALPHIQTAIHLYPESGRAYNVLGGIYYQQNEIEKAKNAFLKAISINKYYAAYENLGLLMVKYDPATSAAVFLNQATNVLPNSDKLWFYRTITENKLGNYQQALISAQNYYLLKNDPTSKVIYSRLLQGLPVNIQLN